jgi:hypothetical protein
VGFKGPWGVSYPTNLRLSVQRMSEEQWLTYARAPRLPPMPVGPDATVTTPFINFVPQEPALTATR